MRVALGGIAEAIDYGLTASACGEPVGPKFLRITDIQDGTVDWDAVPWCECSARKREAARLRQGDIVFARTGATTGKSFRIQECPEDTVFASYLIRVRIGKSADPGYVSHFFRTEDYWGQIAQGARGVAQPGVNATTLRSLQIPLPPLPEQKRIAGILDAADALQAKRREALAQLDTLLQSTFFDMFGDPATNPKEWRLTTLPDIAIKFTDGPFGSNLKSSHYVPHGVRVIRLQNIGVGEMLDDDLAFISADHFASLPRNHCKPGDVVIGTLGEPNLRACVIPPELGKSLNKADCLLLRVDPAKVVNAYVCWLLNCPGTVTKALGLVRGQTRGRISLGRLKALPVPLPPLALQRRFAAFVESVEEQRARMRTHLAELDALFASLQSRAFSGTL